MAANAGSAAAASAALPGAAVGARSSIQAIETTVAGLGYELVETERLPGGLLRVTIDLPAVARPGAAAERSVTVDDCEKVTRQLQYVLEVEGVAYQRLEVSSPGLDRLLRGDADYRRFAGAQVELTLKAPLEGRKRFRGELVERGEGEGWRLLLAVPEAERPAKGKRPAGAKAPSARAAEPATQALDFAAAEVREARLVPVLDFKGRRFAPDAAAAAEVPAADDKTDGGRIQ